MKKTIRNAQTKIILLIAKMRMQIAIRKVKAIYRQEVKARNNERENIQYLVLLSLPVVKTKRRMENGKIVELRRVVLKERLHWVNRKNFRYLKSKGYIERKVRLPEMKQKAFYWTDVNRSYADDYQAQQKAVEKYQRYITANLLANEPPTQKQQ